MVTEADEALAYALAAGLRLLDERHGWRRDALCREPATEHPEFFPGRGESARTAKAACERCLVAAECLAYALDQILRPRH